MRALAAATVFTLLLGCPSPFGGGGGSSSPVAPAETPVFTPTAGTYSQDISVAIESATPGAVIHVTTDGSEPTVDAPAYSGPIAVAGDGTSVTVRAIAAAPGFGSSPAAEASYTIDYGAVSTPQFGAPPGSYDAIATVSISTLTAGATIHYTTDGSLPDTGSPVYRAPVALLAPSADTTYTVRAIAVAPGFDPSTIAEESYTVRQGVVVTSAADSGPGSLRQAIADSPAGGLIVFADDFTIDLQGDPDGLIVNTDLRIQGGDHQVILRNPVATSQMRHFTVTSGTLELSDIQLADGYRAQSGGSVYLDRDTALRGTRLVFSNNRGSPGGAIYAFTGSSVYLEDTRISGGGSQSSAAAIDASTADVTLVGGEIADGQARTVAAGISLSGGSLTIDGVTFRNNQAGTNAERDGGVIRAVNAAVTIDNAVFDGNSASGDGGALSQYGGSLTVRNVVFRDNWAGRNTSASYSGSGGAISLAMGSGFSSPPVIEDSRFEGNTADEWGGAINVASGFSVYIRRSVFLENTALTNPGATVLGGGALRVAQSSAGYVSRSEFVRNGAFTWANPPTLSADPRAGGAILNEGSLFVAASIFHGNEAHRGASAIHATADSIDTVITSGVFAGNVDPAPDGESVGAILGEGSRLWIVNSSLAGNVGGGAGANATYASASTANRFSNSLARAVDGATVIDGVLGVHGTDLNYLSSSGPGAFGVADATYGNAARDPAFVRLPDPGPDGTWRTDDDDYGDLRLQPSSPDIGAGSAGSVTADVEDADGDGNTTEASPLDAAGDPRAAGGIDRGAYER